MKRILNRQGLRREGGMSLIEVLVGAVITLIVVFAALPIMDGAAKTEGGVQAAAFSIGDAREFSDRVLRDVRSAYGTIPPTAPNTDTNSLTVLTWLPETACVSGTPSSNPVQCRVKYVCSGGTCTRQESNPDGSSPGSPITLISGLSSNNVFAPQYTPDRTVMLYEGINVALANQPNIGGTAITLQDGAALRNVQ